MDMRHDHLVSWEVSCYPKKEWGLGLGNLASKNIALEVNGYGILLSNLIPFGYL